MEKVNWNDFEPVGNTPVTQTPKPAAVDWSQFEPVEKPGVIRSMADSALALGKGAASGVKMVSDAAGANNAISRMAGSAADTLGGLESDYTKSKQQAAAQRMKDAEATGSTFEEIKAGVQNFAERPLDSILEGVGSSAPTLLATALTRGKINPLTMGAGAGAVQGAGSVKGQLYDDVERRYLDAGFTPEQAAQKASEAQEYSGKNRDQIALGAGLGAAAGSTGAEASVGRMLGGLAPTGRGFISSIAKGGLSEAPMEIAQGGQERLASNLAGQREGFDVGTWTGVAGQGVSEGLAGFGSGAAFGAAEHLAERRSKAAETLNNPNAGPIARAAATGELSGANIQKEAEAAQAAQAEQAAKTGGNAIDFEKVPLPEDGNRRTLALAEDQPADPNAIDFTPGNRTLTAQHGLENLQYFSGLRNGYSLDMLQRMLPELNTGEQQNTIIPHADGGYTLAPTHLLSDGILQQVASLQHGQPQAEPIQPQKAEKSLPAPAGSFSQMAEFDDLLGEEKADLTSRRQGVAGARAEYLKTEALRRESDLESIGHRVQGADQRRSQAARFAILDQVLADDSLADVERRKGKFVAELRRAGFTNAAPNGDELAHIDRHEQIASAFNTTDVEPAAPNEMPVDLVPEKKSPINEPAAAMPESALPDDLQAIAAKAKTAQQFYQGAKKAGYKVQDDAVRRPLMQAFKAFKQAQPKKTREIEEKANEAATSPMNDRPEPTDAQKSVGNYKKGHVKLHGLNIAIENPAGSTRSGVDGDGKPWENTLENHYGYVKRTTGADGDQVDVFIGPSPESDKVFVVDQIHPQTGAFDEHKVMLGFDTMEQAAEAYQANYADDWTGGLQVTETTVDGFKSWLKEGDTSKPFAKGPEDVAERDAADVSIRHDGDGSTGDAAAGLPDLAQASATSTGAAEDRQTNTAEAGTGDAEAVSVADAGVERAPALEEKPGLKRMRKAKAEKDAEKVKTVAQATASPGLKKMQDAKTARDSAKIADFGQKIGGARKDVWTSFKDDLNAVNDDDIAAQPLSKVWPAPDYQALIDGGMDKGVVGLIRSFRDEIPSKPRQSYKVSRWANQVKTLRNLANNLMDGTTAIESVRLELSKGTTGLQGLLGRADLYAEVGHGKSLEGIRLLWNHYTLYKGQKDVSLWVAEKKTAATAFSNWPMEIATGKTKEDAIAGFKVAYEKMQESQPASKEVSFDIYSKRGQDGYWIGKKVGRNYIDLAGPIAVVKEAREYKANNQAELVAKLEKAKEIPRERRDTNDPRVGEDMRNGQDVTPEMFGDAFGFKGVEFGNWVEQGRRQKDLNEAYDALMDMAAVLGVPPKAISLNSELGLAFGARGSGGIGAASAHYEPSKVVINLTKKQGAGSLGHEWWHALDNYFSRMRAQGGDMMTTALDVSLASRGSNYIANTAVRKEMIDAFGEVVKAIKNTAIKARSSKLDSKRSKEYWTTGEEMSARAFESYLISKLQDQNASNDYLANIVAPETWKAAEALGFELDDSYPYPTAGEMPVIRAGFDHFFNTIQARETDTGVALFDRGGMFTIGMPVKEVQAEVDRLASSWKNAPKINVVESVYDLPFKAPSDARGVYARGQVWMVAENNQTTMDVQAVLFHEVLGHAGLRGIFGDRMHNEMLSLSMKNPAIRAAAAKWRQENTDIRGKRGDQEWMSISIEEALADMAGEGRQVKGLDKLMAAIQSALRAIGFTDLANWLEQRTDAEALAVLANARKFIERGVQEHVFGAQEALAYQRATDPKMSRSGEASPEETALAELSQIDDLFKLPKSDKDTIEGIVEDQNKGITAKKINAPGPVQYKITSANGKTATITVREPSKYGQAVYAYELVDGEMKAVESERPGRNSEAVDGKSDIWIDVSKQDSGDGFGAIVYNIAATYAHNTGSVFIGDPAGVSDDAMRRRPEQMLSSALKFGTTEHLAPHPWQIVGDASIGIGPLDWVYGDHIGNIQKLIDLNLANIEKAGGIGGIAYNVEKGQFTDDNGNELTRAVIDELGKSPFGRGRNAGGATLARAAVLRALSEAADPEGNNGVGAGNADGESGSAGGTLPRQRGIAPDGANDAGTRGARGVIDDRADAPTGNGRQDSPRDASDSAGTGGLRTNAVSSKEDRQVPGSRADGVGLLERIVQLASQRTPATDGIFYSRGSIAGATETLRSSATLRGATDSIKSLLQSDRKFGLWDRTIGTQFNKATKDADFRRVFNALNQQTDDTAHYAIEAERLAPHVLQRLESVKDIGKALLQGGGRHKADMEAIAKPLFANIEGEAGIQQKVYIDDELARDFGLTQRQIEMYREVRLSVDTSIDRLAQSTIAAMGQAVGMDIEELKGLSLEETARAVKDGTEDGVVGRNLPGTVPTKRAELHGRIDELLEHAAHLKENGYMPAMRFGRFAVSVTAPDGDIAFFSMYESQFAANVAKNQLAKDPDFAGMSIESSVMNPDAFAMFQGVSPETVELFGKFMGMEENDAFQQYIALAKSSRSSMKRMLERKGVAGFSDDVGRVMASFITSNARQAAQNFNNREINDAMAAIPREKGDVQQEAQKLVEYIKNPREEAQALRGFLFMHYMGGSVASAAVNLSQPVLQTAPYLSQFASKNLGSIMTSSAKLAATQRVDNPELRAALARAAADGITEPHEIHQLMADASGSALGTSPRARALTKAWGGFFALSESYNRRLTFLAAYQTAMEMGQTRLEEKGFADAYAFAQRAIIETQGLYSKTNRPNWARGPVMATVFTFKQFSIAYIEFFNRLPAKQKAIALAVLLLAAGVQGLPFADDIEDLIDTIGQSMGHATNSKKALRETMRDVFGETAGAILTHGLSSQTGVDLQGRLGLGNLVPGTGLLKTSTTDKFKDMREFIGPVGGVLESFMKAYDKLWSDGIVGAAKEMAPLAVKNIAKGIDTAEKGYYTDSKGRRVMDTTALDSFFKFFGFQPGRVANESRILDDFYQDRELTNNVESAIAGIWARGIASQDPKQIEEARKKLLEWNLANPESRIMITPAQLRRRVMDMQRSRAERFIKAAPKEARATIMEGLQ